MGFESTRAANKNAEKPAPPGQRQLVFPKPKPEPDPDPSGLDIPALDLPAAPPAVEETIAQPKKVARVAARSRANTLVERGTSTGAKTPLEVRVIWGQRLRDSPKKLRMKVLKEAMTETGNNVQNIRSWNKNLEIIRRDLADLQGADSVYTLERPAQHTQTKDQVGEWQDNLPTILVQSVLCFLAEQNRQPHQGVAACSGICRRLHSAAE